MLRKGCFAKVTGEEYQLVAYQRNYYLKSKNPNDLQLGFSEVQGTVEKEYVKQVTVEELEDAYEIFPYAMLKGYRFAVEGYNNQTGLVSLVTSNPFVQNKIEVRAYRKEEYIIELPFEQIEIQEDRLPILGFENRY